MRFKGKVDKTVVKPEMMYGVKTMAVKKPQKLGVAEMRISRWIHGVTKLDRIIVNEIIRGTAKGGYPRNCRKYVEVVWACIEKRRIYI